ncbi:Spc98 family-domain-containing protein [Trichophaea hybrida]|nr:Spc98 family-domain-containing protein [Trichophaea hybrida]KAF8534057.1 Spc98 family-domain-containing protein [Trichophaea hybrida]
METIHVLREFFFLGRGEFALNLIEQSSERVRNRWRRPGAMKAPLSGVIIKEGEVSTILTRTWGVLSSLQGEEVIDERLDTARDLLYLSLYKPPPASTTPSKNPRRKLPRSIKYDEIFSYLISVRKTQSRLQSLWQGRRNPPPQDNVSKEDRARRKTLFRSREAKERKIWATASVAIFFLETLVSYWQGEVMESAFKTLIEVVAPQKSNTDPSIAENENEDGGNTRQEPNQQQKQQQDPESLMLAHHEYLTTIKHNLFMSDIVFAPLIKKLLQECDVMAGGIERLRQRYAIQDLEIEGVNFVGDEGEARGEVLQRCKDVVQLLKQLMGRLHRIDEEREEGAKVDRLLMRMDLGNLEA